MAIAREVSFEFDLDEYSWKANFADFDTEENVFVREFAVFVPDERFADAKKLAVGVHEHSLAYSDAVFEADWPEWLNFLYRATDALPETPPRQFPEEVGYQPVTDFVKGNPKNNDYLVWTWRNDLWGPIIQEMHEELSRIAPAYNLTQVKEKLSRMVVHIHLMEDYSVERKTAADAVIAQAVEKAASVAVARKAEQNKGLEF